MALLEGIKVIDFSKWLPGQYCGMLLGDYGADVVKIEDLQGDATRRFWPEKTKGMSYWHLMLNRNKRGVALNLKKDGGRDLLLKLLQEADVFWRASVRDIWRVMDWIMQACTKSIRVWCTARLPASARNRISRRMI